MQITVSINGNPRAWRRPRRLFVIGAFVLAIAIPAAVLASHDFTDVQTSDQFHTQISAIKAAGITTGCGPTTYCPTEFVRRDAMAAFMSRGFGRLSVANFSLPGTGANSTIASTTIRTEGTAYIVVRASFYAMINPQDSGLFPCERAFLLAVDSVTGSPTAYMRRNVTPPSGGLDLDNIAPQHVFRVTTAGDHTVELKTASSSCAVVIGRGSLVAEVVPFGSTGLAATVVAGAAATGSEAADGR